MISLHNLNRKCLLLTGIAKSTQWRKAPMLDELEKKIIGLIQKDIPVVKRPYAQMAEELGISEEEFLKTTKAISEKGIIRRFGATLRHQRTGFSANAMVAWKIEPEKKHEIGKIFASLPHVSHCYYRSPKKDWPYGIYTMIHARTREDCKQMALDMSRKTGVEDYCLLFSKTELKKTSMVYFNQDIDS